MLSYKRKVNATETAHNIADDCLMSSSSNNERSSFSVNFAELPSQLSGKLNIQSKVSTAEENTGDSCHGRKKLRRTEHFELSSSDDDSCSSASSSSSSSSLSFSGIAAQRIEVAKLRFDLQQYYSSRNRVDLDSLDRETDGNEAPMLANGPPLQLQQPNCPLDMNPDAIVKKIFHTNLGFEPSVRPASDLSTSKPSSKHSSPFFLPVSDDDLANYDNDVVTATRQNDLSALRSLYSDGERTLSCCNMFGESLIHMACRRGFTEIVIFLVEEAKVSIRIADDCGRTPLHDALWNRECKFEIVDMLLRKEPALLLVSDKRGHTPFEYARREHWGIWRQFLWDRRDYLQNRKDIEEWFLLA